MIPLPCHIFSSLVVFSYCLFVSYCFVYVFTLSPGEAGWYGKPPIRVRAPISPTSRPPPCRHGRLPPGAASDGKVYILKHQAGDKRWFKGLVQGLFLGHREGASSTIDDFGRLWVTQKVFLYSFRFENGRVQPIVFSGPKSLFGRRRPSPRGFGKNILRVGRTHSLRPTAIMAPFGWLPL